MGCTLLFQNFKLSFRRGIYIEINFKRNGYMLKLWCGDTSFSPPILPGIKPKLEKLFVHFLNLPSLQGCP